MSASLSWQDAVVVCVVLVCWFWFLSFLVRMSR